MELIIAALILGGCAVGAALGVRKHRKKAAAVSEAAPAARQLAERTEITIEQLRPDDVVMVEGTDYIVAGVARVSADEPDAPWVLECRLDDAGQEAWLVVRRERASSCVLYGKRVEQLAVGDPPSELLDYQGEVFRLKRRGQVALTSTEGDLGPGFPADKCRYWEYQQPGSGRLWLRRGGGEPLVFVGQRVRRHLVTVLPGS